MPEMKIKVVSLAFGTTCILMAWSGITCQLSFQWVHILFFLDDSKHTHVLTEVEEVSGLNNRQPTNPFDHGNRYRPIASPMPGPKVDP